MVASNSITAEQAQSDALRPWLVRATSLIANRLRDARAHAEDGRFYDATDRVDELVRALVDDVLRPAREEFYREAFRTHSLELDPDVVDPSFGLDRKGANAAKRAPILGTDQAADVRRLATAALDELRLAAYAPHADPATRRAAHETWELRHQGRLKSATVGHLSNAKVAIHNAVLHLMIKPERR